MVWCRSEVPAAISAPIRVRVAVSVPVMRVMARKSVYEETREP